MTIDLTVLGAQKSGVRPEMGHTFAKWPGVCFQEVSDKPGNNIREDYNS